MADMRMYSRKPGTQRANITEIITEVKIFLVGGDGGHVDVQQETWHSEG
jgi:hypothetical protein